MAMKALIRKSNETILESDGIVGIDWNTGAPLTNPSWAGGPYRLVQDFVEPVIPGVEDVVEFEIQERGVGVEHYNDTVPETVTIDGKTYTKDELLALLNQTS